MKYFKTFANHSDYESYINGGGVIYPNLSICEQEYDFHIKEMNSYVEIGGLKWATMNLGASSITDYGLYFAWGDTQGYMASQVGSGEGQKYFAWADYKYCDGATNPTSANMTKYNSIDGKTVLDLSDDSAFATWGGNWRIPTKEQFVALGAATTTAWTADYMGSGVAGMIVTDKTDSSKVLFFPAAGFAREGTMNLVNTYGYYRGKSLYDTILNPFDVYFTPSNVDWQSHGSYRRTGFSVRAVLNE